MIWISFLIFLPFGVPCAAEWFVVWIQVLISNRRHKEQDLHNLSLASPAFAHLSAVDEPIRSAINLMVDRAFSDAMTVFPFLLRNVKWRANLGEPATAYLGEYGGPAGILSKCKI